MPMETHYVHGDYNCICDVCGFQYKRSQMKKRWDGAICCTQDWEPRHPQDVIRAVTERQRVLDARPLPEPIFVGTNDVTPESL